MKLIDADALHRKVKMETNPYGKPTIDYDSGVKVLGWIDKAPTIDAGSASTVTQRIITAIITWVPLLR